MVGWAVAAQRNMIAEGFLGDWLLFIDSDMLFPADGLLRLLAHGDDKDIVGAVCLQKAPPWKAACWDTDGHRLPPGQCAAHGGLFECGQLGMAFTLIRRRVFEAMPKPWFELGRGTHPDHQGEDTYFCLKARTHGFRVWADPTIKVWHLMQGAVALGPQGPQLEFGSFRWMDAPTMKGVEVIR